MMSLPALVAALVRTAPGVYPDAQFKEKLNRLKYILRGIWFAKSTAALLEVFADPRLNVLLKTFPRLVSKLQWPFLSSHATVDQKLGALRSHYAFFTDHLSAPIQEALSLGEHWPLMQLAIDEAEAIGLVLRVANYEKEGELALSLLSRVNHELMYTLTFTIVNYSPACREIVIGGLQGHDFTDHKSRVVSITRGMKGLRPKALLLFALQQAASVWSCNALRAVGNAVHIYSSERKRKDLAADYDAFWTESGGVLASDGLFDLPLVPPVRELSEIKPNKRSTYRQRYEMLASIGEQIRFCAAGSSLGSFEARESSPL
jgi:hypothetical protein